MSGPSLVLLHGFLGSARSWDGLVSRLSGYEQIERIELVGHGVDPSNDEETVHSFEDEISRLLEHLRRVSLPSPRWLVGYSLGARVALGLAARVEEPFEHLVLVSGRDGLADPEEALARAALDDALARTLLDEGLPGFVERWEALPLFSSQRSLSAAARAEHRARRLAHDPRRLAHALRTLSLGRMPRYAAAACARTPRVTLVVGEHDSKFRALADGLSRAYGAQVRVVQGAGHDVVLERPDELAALLEVTP